MSDVPHQLEAVAIARALIGRAPTDAERARYADAVASNGIPMTSREARLWRRVVAHPRLYNSVDGALALIRPASAIRQRGYLMLAVLEASPAHTDLFLARARPRTLVVLSVAVTAATGAVRSLVGLAVIAASR